MIWYDVTRCIDERLQKPINTVNTMILTWTVCGVTCVTVVQWSALAIRLGRFNCTFFGIFCVHTTNQDSMTTALERTTTFVEVCSRLCHAIHVYIHWEPAMQQWPRTLCKVKCRLPPRPFMSLQHAWTRGRWWNSTCSRARQFDCKDGPGQVTRVHQ